jgi:hypothetical protein
MRRRLLALASVFGVLAGLLLVSGPATAAPPRTVFCTIANWAEVDLPYGRVMFEYRPCMHYPETLGVPVGEMWELGVCNARPSLVSTADFLDCAWLGYLDWPADLADRIAATRGQYVCMIADHELFRGRYLASFACTERNGYLRAFYGWQ